MPRFMRCAQDCRGRKFAEAEEKAAEAAQKERAWLGGAEQRLARAHELRRAHAVRVIENW